MPVKVCIQAFPMLICGLNSATFHCCRQMIMHMTFLLAAYWRVLRFGLLCLLALCCAAPVFSANKVAAKQGEIDLAALDMAHVATAELVGEWDFYWGKALTPADFATGNVAAPIHVAVPHAWNKTMVQGQALPGHGVATYRLRIKLPAGEGDLMLRVAEIDGTYTLWADGKKLAQSVGSKVSLVRLARHAPTVDLVMQIASDHRVSGGISHPIKIGLAENIIGSQAQRWGVSLAVVGALLVMFFYHLAIFAFARNNLAALFLGIYCLLRAGNAVFSGASDWVSSLLLPQVNALPAFVFGMACLAASPSLLQAFFNQLFPQEFPRKGMIFIAGMGVACTCFGIYSQFIPQFSLLWLYTYFVVVTVYSIVGLARAWRNGRQGALLLLAGYVLLGLAGINDMLNANDMIRTVWLTPVGTLGFILSQAFVLAKRFSLAFSSAEAMTISLEANNLALQGEMAERERLEREIADVAEEERRAISRALHDGLCQELTAARLHCAMLQPGKAQVDAAAIQKLSALLGQAVDQAYELSRGLWPVEQETRGLLAGLEELVEKVRATRRLDIKLASTMTCSSCSYPQAMQVFHIAKEALQNIVKHANASQVNILLDCKTEAGRVQLLIEDNGIGLNAKKAPDGGLGTKIMAHRARMIGGELSLSVRPEGGTRVCLNLPCGHCCQPAAAIAGIHDGQIMLKKA